MIMPHFMEEPPLTLLPQICVVEYEIGIRRIGNIQHGDDRVPTMHVSNGRAYVCNVESFSFTCRVCASEGMVCNVDIVVEVKDLAGI